MNIIEINQEQYIVQQLRNNIIKFQLLDRRVVDIDEARSYKKDVRKYLIDNNIATKYELYMQNDIGGMFILKGKTI